MNRERDDKAVSTFFCGLKNTFENTFSKPCLTLADRSLRHVIRFAPSDLRGDLPSFSEARHSRTTPRRTPPRFARFDVRRRARLHATRSPAARSSEAARALTRSSSSATRVPSTSESDAEKEGSGQVAREKAAGGRDGRRVEDARCRDRLGGCRRPPRCHDEGDRVDLPPSQAGTGSGGGRADGRGAARLEAELRF